MNYQERVVAEKEDLDERLARLNHFKHNDSLYGRLPIDEQERLNTQGHLMCAYSAILGARIAAFISTTESTCR